MPSWRGIARVGKVDRLAVQDRSRPIRLVHAGDDLDQGGFARAVLAQQGMHFAGAQVELHIPAARARRQKLLLMLVSCKIGSLMRLCIRFSALRAC